MSRAPSSASSYDGSGDWFKIAQLGPTFSPGNINWPTQVAKYEFRIPSGVPSGQYLLRVEQIGLHQGGSQGGAQFYISCANVNVVGGGNGSPGPTIKLPGGYSATHPGIMFNVSLRKVVFGEGNLLTVFVALLPCADELYFPWTCCLERLRDRLHGCRQCWARL